MGNIIRIILSLLIISVAAYSIWDYPYARLLILLSILLYSGILFRNRMTWLFFVPALLPVSDLTLYSGRLFLSEFDILLMATVAILLLPERSPKVTQLKKRKKWLPEITIGFIALSYIISSAINLSYTTDIWANNFSSYQSPLNTFRVAKGFFWAMLLWPFLRNQYESNPNKTGNYFISGILTGLFLVGISILWERGVINDLVHWGGLYQIIGDLLDFSTSYRVTGLFSAMHVGGTAIDGYLVMVIPFCFYGFFTPRSTGYQMGSLLCLMLGSYAIMVTFSRGLYGGFLAVILFFGFALCYRYLSPSRNRLKELAALLGGIIFLTVTIVFLFTVGGYAATVGGVFLILATLITIAFIHKTSKILSFTLLTAIILLGTYIIFDSVSESKWTQNSLSFSATVALAIGFIFTGLTFFLSNSLIHEDYFLENKIQKIMIFSLVSCIFWLGVIPPLLNSRVSVRFSTSENDFAHRVQNWRNSLNFREKGILHDIFGTGVGSFPRYYFFSNYNKKPQVSYHYGQEGDVNFLSVGSGDFNITQKIPGYQAKQTYVLRARTRSTGGKYALSLKMCPKHILYSERYTPNCIVKTIRSTGDKGWQQFDVQFDSGIIGQSGIYNWPVTLLINSGYEEHIPDITDIQLLDSQGKNLITNGDFKQKSDRWIMIRDFSHDAWHAKNIFIHMIFEQGYFGLMAFLLLLFVALLTQLRAMKNKDPLAPILIATITGTLVVGLFGTIIDNPRVATLYFLLIFFGLLNSPQKNKLAPQVK